MSSCCGFPPASNEPLHALPAALVALVARWDADHPGAGAVVTQAVGGGNWDAMVPGSLDVPAYTPEQAGQAALAALETVVFARGQHQAMRTWPWYVRWGLVDRRHEPSAQDEAYLEAQRAAVAGLGLGENPATPGATGAGSGPGGATADPSAPATSQGQAAALAPGTARMWRVDPGNTPGQWDYALEVNLGPQK